MSIRVSKIIDQQDNGSYYFERTFRFDDVVDYAYVAGKFQELIPRTAKFHSKDAYQSKTPLFNDAGLMRNVVETGPKGLYYLIVRPKHRLDQIIVEPDDVVIDIYYGQKSLIYSFYNASRRDSIVVRAKLVADTEDFYTKLRSNPSDIIWRQYFVKKSTADSQPLTAPSTEHAFPELMTADQIAKYLHVKVKTIRNWTSEGVIHKVKIGNTVRYKKSEMDALDGKKTTRKKKSKATSKIDNET